MAYKCKVERGSAEEEKINSLLSNMVRSTCFFYKLFEDSHRLGVQ